MCKENYHENEPLQYYCEECKVCICLKCGQTRHNLHSKVDIQEVAEKKKMQRMKILDRARANIVLLEDKMKEQRNLMDKSKEEALFTQSKVTETVEKLIGRLREHEAEIKTQVTKINEAQQREHTKRLADFEKNVTQLKTSIEHDEGVLQELTNLEILQAENHLFSLREKVLNTQEIKIYRPQHVYYVLNEGALNVARPLILGQIVASCTDLSQSTAEGKGLNEAELGVETNFKVITQDSEGSQFYDEGDQVAAKICGPTGDDKNEIVEPDLEDCKDGSYTVRYKPASVGLHKVRVEVNGQPLTGSPWSVQVIPHHYQVGFSLAPGTFLFPWSIALSERTGRVAVAGYHNKCIQLFDKQWKCLKTIGNLRGQSFDTGHPISVAFLRNDDIIFTREEVAHEEQMAVFTAQGQLITRFCKHVIQPLSVFVKSEDGHVIVSDVRDKKIKVLSADGKDLLQSFSPPECNEVAEFIFYHSEKFFASYHRLHCVKVFNDKGVFLYDIGSFGTGEGQLARPVGLAVDAFNQLIVCDTGNRRVQVFAVNGKFLYSIIKETVKEPWFVTVGNNGDVLVSDVSKHCIHVLK